MQETMREAVAHATALDPALARCCAMMAWSVLLHLPVSVPSSLLLCSLRMRTYHMTISSICSTRVACSLLKSTDNICWRRLIKR